MHFICALRKKTAKFIEGYIFRILLMFANRAEKNWQSIQYYARLVDILKKKKEKEKQAERMEKSTQQKWFLSVFQANEMCPQLNIFSHIDLLISACVVLTFFHWNLEVYRFIIPHTHGLAEYWRNMHVWDITVQF